MDPKPPPEHLQDLGQGCGTGGTGRLKGNPCVPGPGTDGEICPGNPGDCDIQESGRGSSGMELSPEGAVELQGPCSWIIPNPALICARVTRGSLSSALIWLRLEQLQASSSSRS